MTYESKTEILSILQSHKALIGVNRKRAQELIEAFEEVTISVKPINDYVQILFDVVHEKTGMNRLQITSGGKTTIQSNIRHIMGGILSELGHKYKSISKILGISMSAVHHSRKSDAKFLITDRKYSELRGEIRVQFYKNNAANTSN